MRECDYCGKPFNEKNGYEIFCSEECRYQQRLLKRRIKRKEKIEARGYKPRRSHLEWTDEDVQNRINTKSSKIIYLGGYTNSEAEIYLQCADCGYMFKRRATLLRKKRPIQCDNCVRILSEIREKEHRKEISLRAEEKRQATKERKESEYIKTHTGICQRCGRVYLGRPNTKYCSRDCARRQHDSNKTHLRRIRMRDNYFDNISLNILAKRDNDICWICKKKVDWTDKTYSERGATKAGRNYPSIDHVVALKNGGTHTWDNVRLAHRQCNTEKSNKLFGSKKNGQVVLFI